MTNYFDTRPDVTTGSTTRAPGDDVAGHRVDDRGADGEWPQGPEISDRGTARVSVWAALGLMIGLVGLGVTLTGLLAPEGVALGGLGLLVSLVGVVVARRPAVAGRGLAVLGVLFALAAVAVGVVAMTGDVGWPNSQTNEVGRLHDWLVDQWSWLGRW
ncbi:MAG TPA: hypothetical protein VK659_12175 [Asanoa sp.]|nr:hypothetical protein [Asanoa sp.]